MRRVTSVPGVRLLLVLGLLRASAGCANFEEEEINFCKRNPESCKEGSGTLPHPDGNWTLDEGSGLVAHDSSGSSDMTLHGDARWTAGIRGKALHFDGNGDFAETSAPVLDTRNDHSISAWVNFDAVPDSYTTAVSQDGSQAENPFYLQYGYGTFAFSEPGGHRATYTVTPSLGRWYHLVGVRAGDELRLYLDGERVGVTPAGAVTVSTGPLAIGRAKYAGDNTDYWNGSIDEVQVFGRALNDSEVSALYASVPH